MAFVNVYNMPVCSPLMFLNNGFTDQLIDASNDSIAVIFKASKSASITKIGAICRAKTGTAPTFRFALEGVTDTRVPDGVVLGSGTAKYDQANPSTGFSFYTLDTPFTTTKGNLYAITVNYLSGTINASNNATFAYTLQTERAGPPFAVNRSGGTWSSNTRNQCCLSVQYSDGSYETYLGAITGVNSDAWNSGSNPLQRGNAWVSNIHCKVSGVLLSLRVADASDFNINVYEGSNTTPISTITIDSSRYTTTNSVSVTGFYLFDSEITIIPETVYRFTVQPTTATNITTFFNIDYYDTEARETNFGKLYKTTSPSSISWSDSTSSAYMITPVISKIFNGEYVSIF